MKYFIPKDTTGFLCSRSPAPTKSQWDDEDFRLKLQWEEFVSTRPVVYDEEDLVYRFRGYFGSFVFQLPLEAQPWSLVCFGVEDVEIK